MKELDPRLRRQIRAAKTDASEKWGIGGREKKRKSRAGQDCESVEQRTDGGRRVGFTRMNGITISEGRPLSDAELKRRKALIPEDTRDFTARFCGDPIPNDPRRAEA